MAEPPQAAPPRTGASGPDGLLATKLYAPRPQPGFVLRPRLVEGLDHGLAQGLTLVCAPAGFGKTALLADWAQRAQRPVAWLSLDPGDNDPARFWRHVAAQPGEGEVVLVLDDYHLIDAQPVHASLAFLLEHRPPELQLVLTCRADPPLPLARLRGRGQLAELRAAELRFTAAEAAALLRQAVGPDLVLPDTAVAALTTRTEGWAVGLQLAGLSLAGQSDVAGFVETFSGSHRYVLDYLTEEVLERQPEPVRTFLLETSVLERLSGALCDAVTGRSDGQAMLEAIERANLFLVPLDEVRGWWRYHQLFADLLRARLQRERPERVDGLHRNAAAWSEAHGLADDAVRHALAAGDVEAIESPLGAAERAFAAAADEPYEPSVGRAASVLTNVPAAIVLNRAYLAHLRGDAESTAEFAYQRNDLDAALEHVTEGIARCRQLNYTQPLATGLATLAWIRQAQGDPAGALEAIGEAARVASGPGVAGLLNVVPAQRARLLVAQGDIVAADRWTRERGLGADDQVSYPREPGYLVLARVLLARDRPEHALGLLERLHALAVAQGRVGSLIEIQALRALALAGVGEEAGAVAALVETLTLARPEGYVRVFADQGAPMGALLGRLVAAQRTGPTVAGRVPLDYLGRLVRAFQPATAASGPRSRPSTAVVPGLVEPLSERELEVLRLLAVGKPNQQIAEELVVAVNTVKKHVAHLLAKLGAANRTEATARARQLGLLR